MRFLVLLLILVSVAACDSSSTPEEPAVVPYTVRYRASIDGRGRVDSLALTYTGASGVTLSEPSAALPAFDRTVMVPPGRRVSIDFQGIYQVTPDFPPATLLVEIEATRNGQRLTASGLDTGQGTQPRRLRAQASVALPN